MLACLGNITHGQLLVIS